jgi:Penicillin-insensitive murein endopeptidase
VRLAVLLLFLAALAVPGVLLAAPRDDDAAAPRQAPGASPAPLPPVQAPRVRPAPPPAKLPQVRPAEPPRALPPARAAGVPWSGRLVHGRRLSESGPGYITWDPIHKQVPNRSWRRWGTGRLLGTVKRVLSAYARRHPDAPPVLVGDLSRPRGGDFGPRFGGIGHASHQNGLDADVYYPRIDGRLRSPARPALVDRAAAQELVDAFVRAGAERVFVGPSLDLRGPPDVVQPLVNHDNHLHVRLPR